MNELRRWRMPGRSPAEKRKKPLQKITKVRGVKGAASWCALAAIGYLAARALFDVLLSFLMGLRVEGASLANPIGFSQTEAGILSMLASAAAILVPVLLLLRLTRLQAEDLRLLWPMPWSPLFCLSLFLGVANAANLFGSLLARLLGTSGGGQSLPAGGSALLVSFLSLCVIPALLEELFFRGALQGLMRPSGSAAAIFGPALLFALLHLDLAQGITAFVCGVFLGWLTERTGSILPGMLLHLVNNTIAFTVAYLQLYAPRGAAIGVELFVLLFFPLLALWMVWHAMRQGFRFSAGLRPGVDAWSVLASPTYTVAVLFLVFLCVYQSQLV